MVSRWQSGSSGNHSNGITLLAPVVVKWLSAECDPECICHYFQFGVSQNQVLSAKSTRIRPGNVGVLGRMMGPVSHRRVIVGEILVGSLGSEPHTICHLLTSAHWTPKPVALCRCDLQSIRRIWLWPLEVRVVLLCSCTLPELASYSFLTVLIASITESFILFFKIHPRDTQDST